jgi:hypothetical protein
MKMWVTSVGMVLLLSMTACNKDGDDGVKSERNLLTDGIPPVAVANIEGGDIVCPSASPVKLMYDGSQSFDKDGKIIAYEWFININGSDMILDSKVKGEISDICKMVGDKGGVYEVGVTVEDNDGNRVTDTKMIEVKVIVVNVNHKPKEETHVPINKAPINKPPVAKAGADKTVTVNTSVRLDGSASSDSDGRIVRYEWKEGTTLLSNSKVFDYTPASTGDHIITLTVTDDDGAKGKDTVKITATDDTSNDTPNEAPVAVISTPKDNDSYLCYINENDAISLDGHESDDPDGDVLTYQWSGTAKGVSFDHLIENRDKEYASVPLGGAGDGGLCDFASTNCESDGSSGCYTVLKLKVNDGKTDNTEEVKVLLIFPI